MRRTQLPLLVLAALAAAAVLHGCGAPGGDPATEPAGRASQAGGGGAARVVRVVDGDTLKVRLADGRQRTVRVLGIDTPETRRPGTPIECGGPQASAAMRRLALEGSGVRARGRAVTLVADPSQDAIDRYGRAIAYVDAGGRDLGETLVAEGWADVYVFRRPFRRLSGYERAKRRAEDMRAGVWGLCEGDFHSSRR